MLYGANNIKTVSLDAPIQYQAHMHSLPDLLFSGQSLVTDGALHSTVSHQARLTGVGDFVDCYRNLNKPNAFSIKQLKGAKKGLVSGYARSVVLYNPGFVVGEKSRQTVQKNQCRNVHAYVRGYFVEAFDGDIDLSAIVDYQLITYSPYVAGHFFESIRTEDGRVITENIKPVFDAGRFNYAVMNGRDVVLCNF